MNSAACDNQNTSDNRSRPRKVGLGIAPCIRCLEAPGDSALALWAGKIKVTKTGSNRAQHTAMSFGELRLVLVSLAFFQGFKLFQNG